MDNEAIVEQIVRSLSFEVIAVPQNVVEPDTSSKLTPVNLRIRVRKKNDSGLKDGVLSMPKVVKKNNVPERIRLVSSDHTIMSFNVIMEGEIDEVDPKHRPQNLNMIAPVTGLQVYNEDDNCMALSKNVNNASPIFSRKHKDIFGTCKPGGCLDPPFGEEKYSYQPTPLALSLPAKDDTAKLKTSSIFKNTLFKRRKKSNQDDQLSKNTKKTNEADSILSLYESESHTLENSTTYSNSIITYPHISNSSELRLQEEQLKKKRYSSEDKPRSSSSRIEGNGSYYVVSKKTKTNSIQSDMTKSPENYAQTLDKDSKVLKEKSKNDYDNSSNLACIEDHRNTDPFKPSKLEVDEPSDTSTAHGVIHIPLNALLNDSKLDTVLKSGSVTHETSKVLPIPQEFINQTICDENELNNDTAMVLHESVSNETLTSTANAILPAKQKLNYTSNVSESTSFVKYNTIKDIDNKKHSSFVKLSTNDSFIRATDTLNQERFSNIQIFNDSSLGNIQRSNSLEDIKPYSNNAILFEPTLLNDIQSDEIKIELANVSKTNQKVIPENEPSKDSLIKSNKISISLQDPENISSICVDKYTEIKSHPLVPNKEREKSLLDVTADIYEPIKNVDYSTEELKHLYKNKTGPLKSVADVIATLTLSESKEKNLNNVEKNEVLELQENVPYDETDLNKENLKLKSSLLKTKNLDDTYLKPLENKLVQYQANKSVENIYPTQAVPGDPDTINLEAEQKNGSPVAGLLENVEKLLLTDGYINDEQERSHLIMDQDLHDKRSSNTVTLKPLLIGQSYDSLLREQTYNYDIELEKKKKDSSKLSYRSSLSGNSQQNIAHYDNNQEFSERSKNLNFHSDTSEGEIIASDQIAINVISENLSKLDVNNEITSDKRNQTRNNIKSKTVEELATVNKVKDAITIDINKSTAKQSPVLLLRGDESDLVTHQPLSESLERIQKDRNKSQEPTTILRKQHSWKIDIALESYINENNEKVIKSFKSEHHPGRRKNDAILVVQCDIGESNEIKIPIDHENDLCIQIKNNRLYKSSTTNLDEKNVTIKELNRKNEIERDYTDPDISAERIDNEDVNMSEANTYNKIMSEYIREVLVTVYEQELVPLKDIIKGLREEIDMMSAYQMKFRETARKLAPKRSRPLKLVGNKRCVCIRKM